MGTYLVPLVVSAPDRQLRNWPTLWTQEGGRFGGWGQSVGRRARHIDWAVVGPVCEALAVTEFYKKDLSGARFEEVDFTDVRMRNVYFVGALIRGAWLENVDIDGEIRGLSVNGVDIGPLVEAELDRRDPRRTTMRPTTAAGFRQAWPVVEQIWAQSQQRAQQLPRDLLHERVEGEWSYIQTLRHLVFATDAWVLRAVLGHDRPYSPLGLLHTEAEPDPLLPDDPDARPSLEEILTVRGERMTSVAKVIAGLTDEQLASDVEISTPGYPAPGTYSVQRCVGAVVHEEWAHWTFAERDLGVLEQRLHGRRPVTGGTMSAAQTSPS